MYETHYVPHIDLLGGKSAAVAKNQFTTIKKKYRPNFKKHNCLKKKGYDHLSCQECGRLQREMAKASKNDATTEEEKDYWRKEFSKHLEHQMQSRQHYYNTRSKVVKVNPTRL